MNRRLLSLVGLLAVCGLLVGLTPALAQDTLRIGTVTAPSGTGTVTVPVHLRDISGTPLGRDRAAGLRITGLAMQVVYGPLACVTNSNVVSTAAAGLIGTFRDAATCGTIFEFKAKVPGTSQSYVFNAPEAAGTDPCGVLPLTLDAAAPGDKLVDFTFTLNGCPLGTVIPLTMSIAGGDAATLNSDSGTAETVANGGLAVVNGQITVPAPTVELTPDPTNLVIGSTALMTATMSFALTTDTVVTLASSDVTKATVPATVTIPANQTTATFTVTGVGAGSSTITATLPAAAGGDTDTALVNVAPVTIALTPDPLSVAVGLTSPMTVTIGPARTTNTVITLASSDPTKVTVPATVTVLANQTTVAFPVTTVAVGSSTITATLPAVYGSAADTATVNVTPVTVTLSPKPLGVLIGGTGTMTATLSSPQLTNTVVTLVSSDPTKATVPVNVTVLAGVTSRTFTVTGVAVGVTTITATLPASLGADTDTATVNVSPVTVALTPDPLAVVVGGTGSMTVTITPAQATATTVTLVSSDPTKATVPASVSVPASGSATFTVTAVGVGSTTITSTLPAALGSATDTATVNVSPVTVALTPDPLAVVVGATGQMTVTITPARATATTVTLVSSDPTRATVPASVSVPASGSATFTVTAVGVGPTTITSTLPAALGSATDTATVNVTGITIGLAPGSPVVAVGGTVQLTVTINHAQPSAVTVSLVSSTPAAATVPATVSIPANATSATFLVTGVAVGSTVVSAILPAPLGGGAATSNVSVQLLTLVSISAPSVPVPVGADVQVTVTLNFPAPTGGSVVALSALPTGIFTFPSSVTVPAGSTTASFSATAVAVGSTTISATLGSGAPRSVVLVANVPAAIPSLSLIGLAMLASLLALAGIRFLGRS